MILLSHPPTPLVTPDLIRGPVNRATWDSNRLCQLLWNTGSRIKSGMTRVFNFSQSSVVKQHA